MNAVETRRLSVRSSYLLCCVLFGFACASGNSGGTGNDGGDPRGVDASPNGADASTGPCGGCPDGTWDLDGDSATGTCGCEYSCNFVGVADVIDINFTDDNCDGSDFVMSDCIFVSASLGSAGGSGTRGSPIDTINAGIAAAKTQSKAAVCVSAETYDEAVTVESGISLYGGFDHLDTTFAFRRSSTAETQVRAPGVVFFAPQIDSTTQIAGFSIRAQTPTTPGESSYGVLVSGGTGGLFVRFNTIIAESGSNGGVGSNGPPHSGSAPRGNDGQNGCSGSGCNGGVGGGAPTCPDNANTFAGKGGTGGFDDSNGGAGDAGSAAAPAGGGGGDSVCFSSAGDGGPGCPGASGCPAAIPGGLGDGGGASGPGGIAADGYAPPDGAPGSPGGSGLGGSGGGGGGGGGDGGGFCTGDRGGGGGSGGCGGLGGNPGAGGGGGGGSFAVFALASLISVTDNILTTGAGGDGGSGGSGGTGQSGGGGGSRGGSSDDGGKGGVGGVGSTGGIGGPGGGGGGGPSACFGYAASVTSTFMDNACTPGSGGQPGSGTGTAADGTAGTSSESLELN